MDEFKFLLKIPYNSLIKDNINWGVTKDSKMISVKKFRSLRIRPIDLLVLSNNPLICSSESGLLSRNISRFFGKSYFCGLSLKIIIVGILVLFTHLYAFHHFLLPRTRSIFRRNFFQLAIHSPEYHNTMGTTCEH